MGNLSDLLKNPSTSDQTLQSLVTAVLEDEASAYGGGLSGAVTPGKVPLFVAAQELADSPIDVGITFPDTVFIDGTGLNGAPSCASVAGGAGGIFLDAVGGRVKYGSADGLISIIAGKNLILANAPLTPSGSAVQIKNQDSGGISIEDIGGGGVQITSNTKAVTIGPIVAPSQFFSVAGTPLPDPATVDPGTEATVSDALTPTYMGPYQSGGAVVCKVISDGATGWFTH